MAGAAPSSNTDGQLILMTFTSIYCSNLEKALYEREEGCTEEEKKVEKEDGLIGSESSAESSFLGTFQGTVESSTISAEHVQVNDADSGTANVAVVKKDEEVNWRMMDDDTPVSMISSNFDISPSQLQYWRVEHDVVISDMKAWKAENSVDNGDDDNNKDVIRIIMIMIIKSKVMLIFIMMTTIITIKY